MYRVRINKAVKGEFTKYPIIESKIFNTLEEIVRYISNKFSSERYDVTELSASQSNPYIYHINVLNKNSSDGKIIYNCLITKIVENKKGYILVNTLFTENGFTNSKREDKYIKVENDEEYINVMNEINSKFNAKLSEINRDNLLISDDTICTDDELNDVYNFKLAFLYNNDNDYIKRDIVRFRLATRYLSDKEYAEGLL